MRDLPENCLRCGLYQNCQTWKIPARYDRRTNQAIRQDKTILCLGQAPGYYEDKAGQPFVGKSGEFLQQYLDELECRWVVDNSLKCYPGRDEDGDIKPTKEQMEACWPFVADTIERVNPDVIVCLGKVAMQTVLGKDAPKSLRAASAPRQLTNGGPWVICVDHPANHIAGRTDLFERYIAVFTQAENLALGRKESVDFEWTLVQRKDQAWEILQKLDALEIYDLYLDVETGQSSKCVRKLTYWHPDAKLLTISVTVCFASQEYFTYVFAGEALDPLFWRALLKGRKVWAHNTKFDMGVMWRFLGFNPYEACDTWDDTFGWFYLRNQSVPGNSLKNLAQVHLGAMPWADEVWKKVDEAEANIKAENKLRKKEGLPLNDYTPDFRDVQLELLAEYNARDTFWTARLAEEALPKIQDEINPIAHELFTRATYALNRVERRGLPVDTERLLHLQTAVENKIEELRLVLEAQPEVQSVTGGFTKANSFLLTPDDVTDTGRCVYHPAPVNVKSFKFMERLAERLEHHTGECTEKSGRLRFSGDILKYLAGINPPVEERTRAQWIYYYIYHIRQNRDLSSKFLKNLINYSVDGRIKTSYILGKVESLGRVAGGDMEGGAETGRLSSRDPNLQNLKKDKVLRSCFRALAGWVLAEADYDRIELVVLAALANDLALIEDVAPGNDPHTAMGRVIAETLRIEYNEEVRDLAKRVNFGKIYGQTPEALAAMTGISLLDAMRIHAMFDERYHGVAQYFADIKQAVDDGLPIVTPFGRTRTFPLTGNPGIDGHAYRQACNSPIQSVASDITLWKLCEVFEFQDRLMQTRPGKEVPFHPFNIVHDSHWHEIKSTEFNDMKYALTHIMEDMSTLPFDFPLPLKVSWKIGNHLGDMKEV